MKLAIIIIIVLLALCSAARGGEEAPFLSITRGKEARTLGVGEQLSGGGKDFAAPPQVSEDNVFVPIPTKGFPAEDAGVGRQGGRSPASPTTTVDTWSVSSQGSPEDLRAFSDVNQERQSSGTLSTLTAASDSRGSIQSMTSIPELYESPELSSLAGRTSSTDSDSWGTYIFEGPQPSSADAPPDRNVEQTQTRDGEGRQRRANPEQKQKPRVSTLSKKQLDGRSRRRRYRPRIRAEPMAEPKPEVEVAVNDVQRENPRGRGVRFGPFPDPDVPVVPSSSRSMAKKVLEKAILGLQLGVGGIAFFSLLTMAPL